MLWPISRKQVQMDRSIPRDKSLSPEPRSQLSLLSGAERGRPVSRSLSPVRPTVVYDTYWRFAAERQEVFFRKLEGQAPPWTGDPVIARHKFTNAYRAAYRVSQYLIRHVIYEGDQSVSEVFFRAILFKLFNKIETWELLKANLGDITWEGYSFDASLGRFGRQIPRYLLELLQRRPQVLQDFVGYGGGRG